MQGVHDSKAQNSSLSFTEYPVQAKRLSSFITGRVDLLKMDIEGAEGSVIKELAESGALTKIDSVIMEYHHNRANISNDLPKLLSTLHEQGFKTLIYENELSLSSEQLMKQEATHFLLRASQV